MVRCLVQWLAGMLVSWLVLCLVEWLARMMVGWMFGVWLVGWLSGWVVFVVFSAKHIIVGLLIFKKPMHSSCTLHSFTPYIKRE